MSANGVFDKGQADIDLSHALAAGGSATGAVEFRYLQESGDPVLYVNAPALAT